MKNKTIMLSCIAAVAIAAMVGKKTYESHVSETNNLLLQNVEALTSEMESEGLWRGISNSAICPGKVEVKEVTKEITVSSEMKVALQKKGIPFITNADGTITYKEVTRTVGPVYHIVCTQGAGFCWGTNC